MSAFIVSDECINTITNAILATVKHDPECQDLVRQPVDLALLLIRENAASVDYRYRESKDKPTGFAFRPMEVGQNAPAVIKALQCYEYQSCEHPGWGESRAYALIHRAAFYWARRVCEMTTAPAGKYNSAPWG